jgi:hypothetical protein
VLVCAGVMTYLPDVEAVWREFARVVRAGGLVVRDSARGPVGATQVRGGRRPARDGRTCGPPSTSAAQRPTSRRQTAVWLDSAATTSRPGSPSDNAFRPAYSRM